MNEISVEDLCVCFKKLRAVSATESIEYYVEHPTLSGVRVGFRAVCDYSLDKTSWKLSDMWDVVSDYI